MPPANAGFDSVVAGSVGTVAKVVASPQLESQSCLWRGSSELSMALMRPTTRNTNEDNRTATHQPLTGFF